MKGVELTPLKVIPVKQGDVMHALKCTDTTFDGFGEAYFSNVESGFVKGWKRHNQMVMNLIVPVGAIKFVIYDGRKESSSFGEIFEVTLSRDNYQRLTIAPGLWLAFQGVSSGPSMLLNIASIQHDPEESDTADLTDFKYNWEGV